MCIRLASVPKRDPPLQDPVTRSAGVHGGMMRQRDGVSIAQTFKMDKSGPLPGSRVGPIGQWSGDDGCDRRPCLRPPHHELHLKDRRIKAA
jgi:hypothetical protein